MKHWILSLFLLALSACAGAQAVQEYESLKFETADGLVLDARALLPAVFMLVPLLLRWDVKKIMACSILSRRKAPAFYTERIKVYHPFTAPATTPSMMYFWQIRYMMTTGRTVSMMQAIMGPISTLP